jgi:hypothetical protein
MRSANTPSSAKRRMVLEHSAQILARAAHGRVGFSTSPNSGTSDEQDLLLEMEPGTECLGGRFGDMQKPCITARTV